MIKWFEKHNKISLLITFLGAISIFYISSLQFTGGKGTSYLSIVYHFCVFFLLALFFHISILRGNINNKIFTLTIILTILYAISDEFHQFFVPGRACTLFDVFIDTLGILCASMSYFILLRIRR